MKSLLLFLTLSFSWMANAIPGLYCVTPSEDVSKLNLPEQICFKEIYYSGTDKSGTVEIHGGSLAGVYPTHKIAYVADQVIHVEVRKTISVANWSACGEAIKNEVVITAEFDSIDPMEASRVEINAVRYYTPQVCRENYKVRTIRYN